MNSPERIRIGEHVTIYPRGKKRIWCADFWDNGTHCRQSLKTANKKIATQRAMQIELNLANGTHQTPPPEVSLIEAMEDYLSHLKTENRAPKTLCRYRGILTVLTTFLAGLRVTRLHQFSGTLFDKHRAERRKTLRPKSMYNEGVVIKQFMKWCRSRKLIRESPIGEFKLNKPPLVPKEGPGLKEIDAILGSASGQMHSMLATLAFTGMRSGELQRLRKEDIDLAGNWIEIVSRTGAETKSRRSRRVPIHPRLRPILEGHRPRPGIWFFSPEPSHKFPKGGHWISPKKLNDRFLSLLEKLGMPTGREAGFTIHSLRHSFETIAINAGIPQRVVDTWLGHTADKSMAAVYYKLKDEDSQRFICKVPFSGEGQPVAETGNER